jgi:hypothetical protein
VIGGDGALIEWLRQSTGGACGGKICAMAQFCCWGSGYANLIHLCDLGRSTLKLLQR